MFSIMEMRANGMRDQELKDQQNDLMEQYKETEDLQGKFTDSDAIQAWHVCESEKQKILEECDKVRRELYEMGGDE